MSTALPAAYECEVCDVCGAVRLIGPDGVAEPPTRAEDREAGNRDLE